jgi:type VI protein secretion system component Hcp
MQLCLTQKMLQSAVLVRCGHSGAGTSLGFFRMEFSDVRIKSMDWSDGELIKETCRLKFAKVKITYVKRNVDGSSAASMNCQWDGTSNG